MFNTATALKQGASGKSKFLRYPCAQVLQQRGHLVIEFESDPGDLGSVEASEAGAGLIQGKPGAFVGACGALVLGRHRDHGVAVTGSVEVGVDFPQSREFKACAQFADREGTERDHMFVRLNLAAVVKDEHQMGDVLAAKAIGYLPGVEHNIQS
jgi:hypothetical protein